MNNKIYQKPSFQMARIEMNDLCSASAPGRSRMTVSLSKGASVHKRLVLKEDIKDDNWDASF